MAYGESNDHLLDDVTCPVFLFGTDHILSFVTSLSESIKLLGKMKNSKFNRKNFSLSDTVNGNCALFHTSKTAKN